MLENAVLVALVGLAVGLVEIIKVVIGKFSEDQGYNDRDRRMQEAMFNMMDVRDSNGIPVWYASRAHDERMLQVTEKVAETLGHVSVVQHDMLKSLEAHERVLERLLDKLDKLK